GRVRRGGRSDRDRRLRRRQQPGCRPGGRDATSPERVLAAGGRRFHAPRRRLCPSRRHRRSVPVNAAPERRIDAVVRVRALQERLARAAVARARAETAEAVTLEREAWELLVAWDREL